MKTTSRRSTLIVSALALALALPWSLSRPAFAWEQRSDRPNIVLVLADDLGYGDVQAFNPGSKPRLDRLAVEGMAFTDAHSPSSVCTPTRYGVLTGRYCWRSRMKQGVTGGFSPHLIAPERLTVASLLRRTGYHTACFGKWHLGLDWGTRGLAHFDFEIMPKTGLDQIDYSQPIKNGPLALGFETFFGIAASLDMPPYVFIRDDRAVGIPSTIKAFREPRRPGPATADFEAVDVLPALVRESVAYIDERARRRDGPFFVYLPLSAPHTPLVPSRAFQGKSGIGDYGDFVTQVDDAVGQVLDALARGGLAEHTLVVFTSDNGCAPLVDFPKLARLGHHPSYHFRGHKADIFEGGHRMPFLVRWPGKVRPSSTCDDPICLTDVLATCAAIVGAQVPANAGEDSMSLLPDLLGTAKGPVHEAIVHHSVNGSFAIRQGRWKLVMCADSGGWSFPRPGRDREAIAKLPPVQLYDLSADIGETRNVQADHPDVVQRLKALLERYVSEGRSVPGPRQPNDSPVSLQRGRGDSNR